MTTRPPTIMISAGEVSGDIAGAEIAAALLAQAPSAVLFGLGGARMAEAGVSIPNPGTQVGVVGLSEALLVLPQALRAATAVRRRVRRERPDVAVLIGNDLFNASLARWLRRRAIPAVAFCPPQVWVWRAVLRTIGAGFTRVLATFPEEARAYADAGIPTTFVGHHLADALDEVTSDARTEARRAMQVPEDARVLALLPGSRPHEVQRLAPVLFAAAQDLKSRDPGLLLVVAAAEGFDAEIRALISTHALDARVVAGGRNALRVADVAVCCSGTATLEASLLGVPMVIVYRTSTITSGAIGAGLALGVFASDTIGLPNLVLGREVVRELKQEALTPLALMVEVADLLDNRERRDAMRQALRGVRVLVAGHGTMDRVAGIVLAEAVAARHRVAAAAGMGELASGVGSLE